MPSRVLPLPTLPPQGPFAPLALFVARLDTTMVPSDARCPALAFTVGLYEPRRPDSGRADGPLVFRSSPCPRAARRTPPRPVARTSPDWSATGIVFAGNERLDSRVVNLTRLQASRNVAPADWLPPKRLLTPRLGHRN